MSDAENNSNNNAERFDIQKLGNGLTTAPFDARFPNQNQTRNCYQVDIVVILA